jgi:hypothetical protein
MLSCCLTELPHRPVFHGFLLLDSDGPQAWSIDIEHAAVERSCRIESLVTMQAPRIDSSVAGRFEIPGCHCCTLRSALRTKDPRLGQQTGEGRGHGLREASQLWRALFNPFAIYVKRALIRRLRACKLPGHEIARSLHSTTPIKDVSCVYVHREVFVVTRVSSTIAPGLLLL